MSGVRSKRNAVTCLEFLHTWEQTPTYTLDKSTKYLGKCKDKVIPVTGCGGP
jgi:hypothetical protein